MVRTPNRLDVVQQVDREHLHLLQENTTASCTEFRQRVARRLHSEDPGWGELSKEPGEHQGPDGRAVDAIIYAPTQQVIDIIIGAEWGSDPGPHDPRFKPGWPAWQEVEKRAGNHWVAPGAGPIEPGPKPLPPPDDDDDDRDRPDYFSEIVAASDRMTQEISNLADGLERLNANLETLQRDGVKVNWR